MQKYHDLHELIQNDPQAQQYYQQLPDYVRDMMAQRADSVNSFASLRDYADNLTRGDN